MEEATPFRAELLVAGLGGQGILTIGKLLAEAALLKYKNAVWVPSYSSKVRGGPSECMVIFSDDDIDSPVLLKANAVIIVEGTLLNAFEGRAKPGGIVVFQGIGNEDKMTREDVSYVSVPAFQMAVEMGNTRAANLILLGAYITATKVIAPELVEKVLDIKYGKKEKALSMNKQSFMQGLKAGKVIS